MTSVRQMGIYHRRRKIYNIGGPRFRILGGQGGGVNSQQAHDVVTTLMRRNDVASTSFRCHVPTRFLISQCQIITFLILKSDIIENSLIELRGIVLPVPSNQIKVTFIIIFTLQLGTFVIFSCFTWKLKENVGLLGGQRYVAPPPSQIIVGGLAPLPLPTPSSYTYIYTLCRLRSVPQNLLHGYAVFTVCLH